jgi:hypothetical protein
MNTKDLAKIIKIAVKQEIDRSVRGIIKEEVTKAMGTIIAELILSKGDVLSEVANNTPPSPPKEVIKEEIQNRVVPKIKTGNSKLDAVLQETAQRHTSIPQDESVSYSDLVGRFDKIGVSEEITNNPSHPKTNIEFLKQTISTPMSSDAPSSITEIPGAVPDVLKNIFKKDYSAIMKKIDEKKGVGSGLVGMM